MWKGRIGNVGKQANCTFVATAAQSAGDWLGWVVALRAKCKRRCVAGAREDLVAGKTLGRAGGGVAGKEQGAGGG